MKKNSLLLFILAVGFFLRVLPLSQSYWLDESINVRAASTKSFTELVTVYSIGDFHPPLYHLFLRSWILFFGNHEVATRMLSVLFGIGTIYYLYKISCQIFGSETLTFLKLKIPFYAIPSILLSLSGLHIYYSGESRMYSMAAFFTTMSLYYATQLLKEIKIDNSRETVLTLWKLSLESLKTKDSLFFFISLSGMLYSDYVPWMLYPLFLLFIPIQSLMALATLLPWTPFFIKQLMTGLGVAGDYPLWGQVVGGLSLKNIVLIPIKFLTGRVSLDPNWLFFSLMLPAIISTVLLIYYGLRQLDRKQKLTHYLPVLWLGVPLFFGILVSVKVSLLSYFRFIFILPAFYLLLTQGLTRISKEFQSIILAIVLSTTAITTSAYIWMPQFQRENWRGFSEWIDEQEVDSAATLIPSMAQSDPYLFYQKEVPIYDSIEDLEELPQSIYLVRYVQEIFDAEDSLRTTLETLDYTRVEQKDFNSVIVWHYQKTDRIFAYNTID